MNHLGAKIKPVRRVISASRRVELLGCFPKKLTDFLENRLPPEKVHTLVLWTKNANVLLNNRKVREVLKRYDQIYVHYTITGMGGTFLEPYVPKAEKLLTRLPEIIEFVGNPLRVHWRFDPIVHLKDTDQNFYSNIGFFPELAGRILPQGIRNVTVSWMAIYPKVANHLQKYGFSPVEISDEEQKKEAKRLESLAHSFGARVHYCCMEGFSQAKCIDGQLFTLLHPAQETASVRKAKGQRPFCGCTESWDIGWYYPCPYGCLYCYANPRLFPVEAVLAKGWHF
ncbi:hypothetical protein BMS3Abin05_02599 [bacterium BMS3Abin05]|nr:hypothetical protein BMS3Abin05_02599 [bacterium BMS3Abin05]GBE27368.1 hypothetical protein BMS3Bbin03_01293 [bacterium BMS3Bbin03]HDK35704.1 DUF1848 family protein [Bacteroidota bacterium]